MELITKEYEVYNFDELSDDVKKKLIERERENQKELYCECWLEEDMGLKASYLINDYFGITSDYLKTYYSLSYCQGDGAMIEFNINIKDLNNKYKVFSDEEIRYLINESIVNDIRIRHNDYHYYHEYTFTIDYDFYNDLEYDDIKDKYNITESDFNTIDDRFYKLVDSSIKHNTESEFVKDIINMNKELTKYGYDCIEYYWYCDDDEIIAYINDNDNRYLESGDEFYG